MYVKFIFLLFIIFNFCVKSSSANVFLGLTINKQKNDYNTTLLTFHSDTNSRLHLEKENLKSNFKFNGSIFIGKSFYHINQFQIDFESGIDIGKFTNNINSHTLSIQNKYQLYFLTKLGKSFKDILIYANLGIGFKDLKIDYKNLNFNKFYINYIFGIGLTYKLNNHWNIFAEFNVHKAISNILISSLTLEDGEIDPKSTQFKLGFKYYLHQKLVKFIKLTNAQYMQKFFLFLIFINSLTFQSNAKPYIEASYGRQTNNYRFQSSYYYPHLIYHGTETPKNFTIKNKHSVFTIATGYRFNEASSLQIGIDFVNSKFNFTEKQKFELESNKNINIIWRIAYNGNNKLNLYVNIGAGVLNNKITNIQGKTKYFNSVNFIFGLGFEYKIAKNWTIFTEFNSQSFREDYKIYSKILNITGHEFKTGFRVFLF